MHLANSSKDFLAGKPVIVHEREIWQKPGKLKPAVAVSAANKPTAKYNERIEEIPRTSKFFRRFLPRAAHNQTRLSYFLKGSKRNDNHKINWSEQAKSEFQNCKALLANATLLVHPNPNANLVLQVDASDFAIGGALFQTEGEHLQPLAFFSRKLSETEKGYSAYDRELLAAYASIKQFRYMLRHEISFYARITYHSHTHLNRSWTSVHPAKLVNWILYPSLQLIYDT
ncbi:uncharacterized protein TNCT_282761 [Trichonephila clavata]|uniref:Reverse transcriptase/retrotransposon-derived protein RNase H-like domain-containing protein n=1 Tax=Trichonephila clavata TaxID=2740835 RepID=A0A8X6G5K8_TRICU|nr:uncharacterized protein TNCT_282761 [Trichonephila clavata]